MVYIYKNIDVSYKVLGEGETLITLLHGWGGSAISMMALYKKLADSNSDFRFLLIDFPPFGESSEPLKPWFLNDYVELVEELINKQESVEENYLIGHSFGGRVAIKIAAKKRLKIKKLILLSSAGIKPRFSIKTKLKILMYKILKKIGFKNNASGSRDYRILSPIMKKTFINIIKEDLNKICKQIDCKTLLIFGTKDKETPLYMGKTLNKKIKNSELIILKGGGHFSHIYNLNYIFPVISTFLSVN